MKWFERAWVAAAALMVAATMASATGLFPGLPLIGGAAYCAGSNIGSALSGSQCSSNVPAGPSVFTGNEVAPFDLFGPLGWGPANQGQYPQSAFTSILQLNNGLFAQMGGSAVSPFTPASGTSWLYINGTYTNPTINLPAGAIEGQFFHIILGPNLTTGITTASTLTCQPACGSISGTTAGTTYGWRASTSGTSLIWFRIQ